jgi:hypothetical protein
MGTRQRRLAVALACSGLLLVGCGGDAAPTTAPEDAGTLIAQALAARSADRLSEFADLVAAAGTVCPDPRASGRLGELAVMAGRWASAVELNRPKVQAVTEAQLADVDWQALAAACVAP